MKYFKEEESDADFRLHLKKKIDLQKEIDPDKKSLKLKMYLNFNNNTINNIEVYGNATYDDTTEDGIFIIEIELIDFDLSKVNSPNKIFIWGYLAHDFKTIEKDYIYNAGIASIKHLTDINYIFHEINNSETELWKKDSIGSIVYLGTKITEKIKDATIEILINETNFTVNPSLYNNKLIIKFDGIIIIDFSNSIDTLKNMLKESDTSNTKFGKFSQIDTKNIFINANISFYGKINSSTITDGTTTKTGTTINFKNNNYNMTEISPTDLIYIKGNLEGMIKNVSNKLMVTNKPESSLSFIIEKFNTNTSNSVIFNSNISAIFNSNITSIDLSIPQTTLKSTTGSNTGSNTEQVITLTQDVRSIIEPLIISTAPITMLNHQFTPSQLGTQSQLGTKSELSLFTTNEILSINSIIDPKAENSSNYAYNTRRINYAYKNYYTGIVCDIIEKPSSKIVVIAKKGIIKLMYKIKDKKSLILKYGDLLCTSTDSDEAGFVIKQDNPTINTNTIAKCLMDISFDENHALNKFVKIESLLI